jgi:trk system potassium uptake protein TrkH
MAHNPQTLQVPRVLCYLLSFVAISMTPSLVMSAACGEEKMTAAWLVPMLPVLAVSLYIYLKTRGQPVQFSAADGFLLVFLAWAGAGLMGALPFYVSGWIPRFSSAVFESVSGFTTTGASVIADVEAFPRSLILWRGVTHWLGGMGIVVLTVALLPLLGIGGVNLVKAETTGPDSGDKITPKITKSAKILWGIYAGFTALLVLLFRSGGMPWFDAVFFGFSVISSGGCSSRNAGLSAFASPYIEWVAIVFMIITAYNYTLYFYMLKGRFLEVWKNSEGRAYFLIIAAATVLTAFPLQGTPGAVRRSLFHVASIVSTTGLVLDNHDLWPALSRMVLFLLMFIGACSGSTAGGLKVTRYLWLGKQARAELRRFLYPNGVFGIFMDGRAAKKEDVYGVAAFFFAYLLLVFAGTALLGCAGLDPFSALNGSLLAVGNIGVGQGAFSPAHSAVALPVYAEYGLAFLMIAGRLEIWTALVVFSREYWKR